MTVTTVRFDRSLANKVVRPRLHQHGSAGRRQLVLRVEADKPTDLSVEILKSIAVHIAGAELHPDDIKIESAKATLGYTIPAGIPTEAIYTISAQIPGVANPPGDTTAIYYTKYSTKPLLELGDASFSAKKLKEAEFCWASADTPPARLRLVTLLLKQDRIQEARQLSNSTASKRISTKVSRYYVRHGKYPEAIAVLRDAYAKTHDVRCLEVIGAIQARSHDHDGAIATWKQCGTAQASEYLALLYHVRGQEDLAHGALIDASKRDPNALTRTSTALANKTPGNSRVAAIVHTAEFAKLFNGSFPAPPTQ